MRFRCSLPVESELVEVLTPTTPHVMNAQSRDDARQVPDLPGDGTRPQSATEQGILLSGAAGATAVDDEIVRSYEATQLSSVDHTADRPVEFRVKSNS
jgi:hypothetical protein